MASYDALLDLVRGHVTHIQAHDFPDPDAFGAAFGLQYIFKVNGIEADIVYSGRVDTFSTRRMLELFDINARNERTEADLTEVDYVITVDGQKYNSNFTDICGDEVACIDHHQWTTEYKYQFVDHRICGACSSIITSYFIESNIVPPKNVATALLYGIRVDTKNFSRGVTKADIEAFSFLHPLADNNMINLLENSSMELDDLRAFGEAFKNIKVYDKVGFTHISFDCPDALLGTISDFILSLAAVDIAVVYADRNGGYKFSIRSEVPDINAGKLIADALNGIGSGGGHQSMAGGVIFADGKRKLGIDPDFEISKRFMEKL